MMRITYKPTGCSTIHFPGVPHRLYQRNASSSTPSSALVLSPHLHRAYSSAKGSPTRICSTTTVNRQQVSSSSSTCSLRCNCASCLTIYSCCPTTPQSQQRGFRSATAAFQSRALDGFHGRRGLEKNTLRGSSTSVSTGSCMDDESGILSDQIMHPRPQPPHKKTLTLEEAMGDIKPLVLSPESMLMKEKELQGAKIIDGKAIAK
ncbi:hypothetical protein EDD21DRAFT_136845 [Dissophora ornata]|nr:hypothetical protein EDD21DRAFT_136845 [Dissophora ornata]